MSRVLFLTVLLAFLASIASSVSASLIVHKELDTFVKGRNATVSIVLYNLGPGVAKNVFVEDKTFRNTSLFAAVAGKHSKKFASIEENSNATLKFVVKPIVAGDLPDHPAVFKYQVEDETRPFPKTSPGYSSSLAALRVLTEEEAAQRESRVVPWTLFFIAAAASVAAPYYLYTQKAALLKPSKKQD
ncbi:translocon-associated protein subunit beta [Zopfochytrium polystomum]|nr:translocon-associated protein subunit beta [Zopfochytrium polystomum]